MHLVCLPGMDGTARLFAPLVAAAPPSIQTHPLPLPQRADLDWDGLAEDLLARLPIERPLALLAESFSGPLALWLAARMSPPPCAVVLVATFVRPPIGRWATRLPLSTLLSIPPPRLALELLMTGSGSELAEEVQRVLGTVPANVLESRIRLVTRVDVTGLLRQCPAPVLLLTPTRDRLLRSQLDTFRRARPSLTTARVEGPHLLLQRCPDACWAHIAPFLDSTMA